MLQQCLQTESRRRSASCARCLRPCPLRQSSVATKQRQRCHPKHGHWNLQDFCIGSSFCRCFVMLHHVPAYFFVTVRTLCFCTCMEDSCAQTKLTHILNERCVGLVGLNYSLAFNGLTRNEDNEGSTIRYTSL